MAIGDTYTTGLKSFIENNANAGYIRTSSEITTSDIAAAVSQIIGNEYVKANQLAQVATSGNYNHLSNLPTLHDVATSGDYFDLINRPTFHEVATSGDYNKLINKPDIESRVDAEVSTLITNAINDAKTEIKGANVGADYNTLEKLQNIKSEIQYIDVTAAPYNLTNFGNSSFFNSNSNLVNTIINNYLDNKIIILQSNYGNFIVNNLINNNTNCQISLIKFSSNYSNIISQFDINDPGGELGQYIIDNIKLAFDEIYIVYVKARNVICYITLNQEYLSNANFNTLQTTVTNQGQVISALNTNVGTLSNTVNTLSTSYDGMNSSVNTILDTFDELEDRISNIETFINNIQPEEPEPNEPEPEEP